MALIKCKKCNKNVSNWGTKCPYCGVKYPSQTWKDMLLGFIFLCLIILGVVVWLDGSTEESSHESIELAANTNQNAQEDKMPPVDLSLAQPYTVIKFNDISIPNRKRGQWTIVPNQPLASEQVLPTAAQAALDMQRKEKYHVTGVWVDKNKSGKSESRLAVAWYIPDGLGNDGKNDIKGAIIPIWNIDKIEPF